MQPRLIGSNGPIKGQTVSLIGPDLSLGRDSSNAIVVKDPSVSRVHCRFQSTGDSYSVEDMNSRQGTVVNGEPIADCYLLKHGDKIKLGRSHFVFLIEDDTENLLTDKVEWDSGDETALQSDKATKISLVGPGGGLSEYSEREVSLGVDPVEIVQLAQDLEALVRVSAAISTIRNVEALFTRLLELILEATKAARGAVLLLDDAEQDFIATYTLNPGSDPTLPMTVSKTIARMAIIDRAAIMVNDLPGDSRFRSSHSLHGTTIRSVICIPLIIFERVIGVVYLDTRAADFFASRDLKLLTAIVNQASVAVTNIRYYERITEENRRLNEELELKHSLVGSSPALNQVLKFIRQVAGNESTILITGESGTGKELVARAIHQASERRDQPFMPINCAAIAETLFESELFGHERGSFTGAITQHRGKLEQAHLGTVFLDELGEIPPAVQVKLLRVLQEREFERVGGNKTIKVNIRIIAATNRNLEEAVKSGAFREDLYYRLNVISLEMPGLRDRREDILSLAQHFLAHFSREAKKRFTGIDDEAKAALLRYPWPGNVRELQNAIERAVVLGDNTAITMGDLPTRIRAGSVLSKETGPRDFHQTVKAFKREVIMAAYYESGSSLVSAAKLLKLNPTYLSRLLKTLDIKLPVR